MVGNKHGIFAQFETIRPLQPLKNVASPAWQASLRRCMEHFNGEWERGSRLRGLLVQGIAPIDFPLDGLLDEVRPHLSPLLRIANYQAVWDGPELPRLSGRDAAGKLLVQVNPIQTVYVFGADGRKEEHGDGSRYAELAEMAGNVLNQLPPEVSRTIWGDWATGFYCRESKALWTAAVFRLAWKGKLAVISKRVAWDGATTRVLETTAADSRFFAELDDLYSASREAAQYLLELPATIEVVPTTTDATRGTDKSEGDGAGTDATADTSTGSNSVETSTATDGETNRYAALAKLEPAHRKAYLSFLYAEARNESRLQDRDAWDWLTENGIDTPDSKELDGYELPRFDTWTRQLRTARKATGEQKYQPRAGRMTGKSVVLADERDPEPDDE